jgi:primosomal protein N' (replication factor Y) (superfamily II helicase)
LQHALLPFSEEDKVTFFVDVILPVPVPNLYTYRAPFHMNDLLQVGARVIVEFGKQRVLTAVIARIHQMPPQKYTAKYILELLDEQPIVTSGQLTLFEWMSSYYMCHIGEVMNAALPSGMKISSESRLQYNQEFDINLPLTDEEALLLDTIKKHQSLSYEEAENLMGQKIYKVVKSLIGKRALLVFEEVKEKYKPKVVKKVRLMRIYEQRDNLQALFQILDKKPKQLDILLKYLQHVPVLSKPEQNEAGIEKSLLTKDEISESSLKTLIKNQIVEEFEVTVSRFENTMIPESYHLTLTETQQKASNQIMDLFKKKDAVLLYGITGSGKTEIYIDLIRKVLDSGSQVLYLLPEIALTTQIVSRLYKIFGDEMGVYHSKFSDNERVEVWKGVLSGRFSFVIGVRSAIFLPFDNLGLIVVDEEHETSYKQQDPAPRYNARDVALVVAQKQHAKVLLGSATPSFESYYHARLGKFGFVKLDKRFGEAQLPDIVLVDTRTERKQKKIKNNFSSVLLEELKKGVELKEQSILFQNRRGYSPYIACEECNWIAQCSNCAVSLTYHLHNHELRCHYCGHTEKTPAICPACGSPKIMTMGYGTEKVEDELQLLLPGSRLGRMDLDTTRKKNAYQQIITEFEAGNMDVLIGTQMISKGLDFDRVSLVGIFDADRLINFPDFRSHERAFQLITQVSGRAGRRNKKGKVIIQTADIQQNILQKVLSSDYEGLYEKEMAERKKYNYPPFCRMIKISVKHVQFSVAEKAAYQLVSQLTEKLGTSRVLGPESPLIDRIRNQYLKDILIKLEKENVNLKAVKEMIRKEMLDICTQKEFKQVTIVADVDPL